MMTKDILQNIVLNNERSYHLLIRIKGLSASYKSETDPKKKKDLKILINSLNLQKEKLHRHNNQLKDKLYESVNHNPNTLDSFARNFSNLAKLNEGDNNENRS